MNIDQLNHGITIDTEGMASKGYWHPSPGHLPGDTADGRLFPKTSVGLPECL